MGWLAIKEYKFTALQFWRALFRKDACSSILYPQMSNELLSREKWADKKVKPSHMAHL